MALMIKKKKNTTLEGLRKLVSRSRAKMEEDFTGYLFVSFCKHVDILPL